MVGQLMSVIGPELGAFAALAFLGVSYFLLTLDRQRATSLSKDDTQAGIKLVFYALILAGITMTALGLMELLSYMLGGFKGGSGPIKSSLPSILVGALTVLIVAKALLPRTNAATMHQPERYLTGTLGLSYGIAAITGVDVLLHGLFNDAAWQQNAGALSLIVVSGAITLFSVQRFGGLSGWTSPAPAAPPPPQQPGYPPQGGGYPPQGGGYPPQGGGYPPQGGGYPPQGGGYPPQGGGYPPQGGYGR